MRLLHTLLACFLLCQSLFAAPSYPTGKLVLADYHPHHTTRPIGNGLSVWRWDGNALGSSATVKRHISNGDLIGPDGRNQIPCTVYPAVGMQSEEDEDYVEYQILVAKSARIDGFMIEWNSPGKASNLMLRTVAERLGFLVGAVWQADQTLNFKVTPTYGASPTPTQWNGFLADYALKLRQELYDRPTAPKVGGRPLLMFFGWGCPKYKAEDLAIVRAAWGADVRPLLARTHLSLPDAFAAGNFREGLNLVDGYYPWSSPGAALSEPTSTDPELAPLIAANTHDMYFTAESMLAYRERWINYTKTFENQGFPLRMGGIMSHADNRPCGGWGHKMFYVARKDGETARKQWALYKNERSNLDVVFVVTWNDWTEGTIVEPSIERGLQDVTIIEEGASGFKDVSSDPSGLSLPKRLFDLRKGYAQLVRLGFPSAGAKARLDSVADQIANRQFSLARSSIEQEESRLPPLLNRIVAQPSSVTTVVPAATERIATASTPVWLTLPSAVDVLMSTLRCDAELTWEWFDTDFSTYRIYTNSSGTAPNDTIAEIIGSGTGEWKTAKIRVYDTNCWFTRDTVSTSGNAVLKVTGDVKFRNMTFTATRKDLPPVIGMGPSGGSVSSGSPFNLNIEAGGTGTVTYQWRKNGVNIAGANAASLSIPAASSADAGAYDVLVSTAIGSVTSNTATLSVTDAPPAGAIPQAKDAAFSQRADGSKLVDISYTLTGGTASVALGVSLDGGTTFTSVKTLTGDVGAVVTAGTAKQIVWNAVADFPNLNASRVKVRITPLLDGAGGTFTPIPGGTYQMGNLTGDADITNAGTVAVTLSPYYLAVAPTTKAQWDTVRTWAATKGYTDLAFGEGKAVNHPVQRVSWYDALKWANAASEKEGLTPCYKVGPAVVRTGTSDTVSCDWNANGYRLPTEAEWEIAARGGLSGKRFPWGDTVAHSQANYKAGPGFAYDLSASVNDHHPAYKSGVAPYTNPAGSFAANGYGLYDMAGNVWQWCWDRFDSPYAGGADPRGGTSGWFRVFRGGLWYFNASMARSAGRYGDQPGFGNNSLGFRLARGRPSGLGGWTESVAGTVDTTSSGPQR